VIRRAGPRAAHCGARHVPFALAAILAALGVPRGSSASTAAVEAEPEEPVPSATPVRTGTTTHFSQGWPPRLVASAAGLGTVTIRDSLHWRQIEQIPGQYDFTTRNSGHLARACAAGMTVLLGLEPRNPNYDAGTTVWSSAGQAAFARYVAAIAARWPRCVVAIEVGNEINGAGGMTGPAARNRHVSHVALLHAVRLAVKPRHPDLLLVGGSTNTIATGFLARLFAAGMLEEVDAVAVHPYRPDPEAVDWEIARLRAAMVRAGRVKPIWATEFSREFPDPAAAPAYYLKMAALLESAGVGDHFWYALIDQSFFPTMGLLRPDGTPKPAAAAYRFAAATLAPRGPARRVGHGDPALFHFRYGPDTHVIWGTRRTLEVNAERARAFSADGSPVPVPPEVSDTPVVITGVGDIRFGPAQVLADSLYGFARSPLGWFAAPPGKPLVPLRPIDWKWTTYLGHAAWPKAVVSPAGIGTTGTVGTIVRHTAAADGAVVASICLALKGTTATALAPAAQAQLRHNGVPLWTAQAGSERLTGSAALGVRAGDTLELALFPVPGRTAGRFTYRFRVSRTAADAAGC